jgi:hypothetical protein
MQRESLHRPIVAEARARFYGFPGPHRPWRSSCGLLGRCSGAMKACGWSRTRMDQPVLLYYIQSAAVFAAAVADKLIEIGALRQHGLELRAILIVEL